MSLDERHIEQVQVSFDTKTSSLLAQLLITEQGRWETEVEILAAIKSILGQPADATALEALRLKLKNSADALQAAVDANAPKNY